MDTLLSRITIDPAVCHGKPCVRGLRYPVETKKLGDVEVKPFE